MKIDEFRLSKIILSARKRMNLTQNEVSKRTGITQGTLSKIESFHCSVSAKHWFLLSKLLDIPSSSVWTGYIDRGIKPTSPSTKNVFKLPKKYFNNSYSSIKEIAPIIKFALEKIGKERFDQHLAKLKMSDLIFFDLNNKINYLFAYDLLNEVLKDGITESDFKQIAKFSADLELHGVQAEQYQKKNKSSLSLLKLYLDNAAYYQDGYKYNVLKKTENEVTFELEPIESAREYFNNIKDILVPYNKACIESLLSNCKKEKVQVEVKEDTGNGLIQFTANATII
ncbi:helix-turn-helix domain-containing protein [Halobacteriovorax sp.]|uniref:helix-turn-helix domain-containing protein n=1 Tax=Halobacteriovorax sp. TaxID=2020862 RepID=UPI003563BA22